VKMLLCECSMTCYSVSTDVIVFLVMATCLSVCLCLCLCLCLLFISCLCVWQYTVLKAWSPRRKVNHTIVVQY